MKMTTTPPDEKTQNKNLRVWLQTIAIGFGIASVGIAIALVLYLLSKD
jgi:hypothetical protein